MAGFGSKLLLGSAFIFVISLDTANGVTIKSLHCPAPDSFKVTQDKGNYTYTGETTGDKAFPLTLKTNANNLKESKFSSLGLLQNDKGFVMECFYSLNSSLYLLRGEVGKPKDACQLVELAGCTPNGDNALEKCYISCTE